MLFLLQNLGPWAAAALALGLAFGSLSCAQTPERSGWLAAVCAVAIYGCGVAAAILSLAPGEYGFWLDSGLMIGAAYGAGGMIGCVLRRLFKKRSSAAAPDRVAVATPVPDQARLAAAIPAVSTAVAAAKVFDATARAPSGVDADKAFGSAEPKAEESDEEPPRTVGRENVGELRLIHGLDRKSRRGLEDLGVACMAELAGLTGRRQAEIATRLGVDEAIVSYWSAQARLLAHGAATGLPQDADAGEAAPLDGETAEALSASLPQVAPPQAHDAYYPGARPLGLLASPGPKDDLRLIAGLDSAAAKRLNGLGIWTFRQIAAWNPDNRRWIDFYLGAPGRVSRERWVEQAAALAETSPLRA